MTLQAAVDELRAQGGLSSEHWKQLLHEIRAERGDRATKIRGYASAAISDPALDTGFQSRSYLGSRHWYLVEAVTDPAKARPFFFKGRRSGPRPDLQLEVWGYAHEEARAFESADDTLAQFLSPVTWWPGWRMKDVQGFRLVVAENDPDYGDVEAVVKWDGKKRAWIHSPFNMTTSYRHGAYDHTRYPTGEAQDWHLRVFLRPLVAKDELPGVDLVHSSPSQLAAVIRNGVDADVLRVRLEERYGPVGPWEREIA
jgi:hypothetical protein